MVTMADVARCSGVSSSTVSHVINKTRPVNEATRLRVEAAVEALGYRRNAVARTLAGGSSHTIGLAISGLTNPYFGPLLAAIEQRVTEAGYVLVIGDTHDETDMEHRVVASLLDRRVDGLVVAPSRGFHDGAGALARDAGTPLVLIDRAIDWPCDQITPENFEAARNLTAHILGHGHTRVAAVSGLRGLDSSIDRLHGFRAAFGETDLEIDERLVVCGDSNAEHAELEFSRLLAEPEPPTAVVSLNNAMTIGVLRAAQRARLKIPDDLAVVAYDDFEWSDLFSPGLTAVAQDVERMGHRAVDLLFERLRGSTARYAHQVIETTFHRRTSCGCTPAT